MTIETILLHPVLRDYVEALGTVPKKAADAEPKTAFQKWCRGIKAQPRRAAHRPKTGDGFVPRAVRRRSIVGAGPHWRTVWRATGGYTDLVNAFGQRLAAEAAKRAGAAS